MSRRVDLNAARKARDEVRQDDPVLVELGDHEYELPSRLPAAVPYGLAQMANGQAEGFELAVKALFGERVLEALADGLEVDDLEAIAALYGADPEKASASG